MIVKFKNGDAYSTNLYKISGITKDEMGNNASHKISDLSDIYHIDNPKFIEIGFKGSAQVVKSFPYSELQEIIP